MTVELAASLAGALGSLLGSIWWWAWRLRGALVKAQEQSDNRAKGLVEQLGVKLGELGQEFGQLGREFHGLRAELQAIGLRREADERDIGEIRASLKEARESRSQLYRSFDSLGERVRVLEVRGDSDRGLREATDRGVADHEARLRALEKGRIVP